MGCETALYLAQKGYNVTVIEQLDEILADVLDSNVLILFKIMDESDVQGIKEYEGFASVS